MGQFLWYLPGRQTVSQALLDKAGIGDLVGSYGVGRGKGPDGGSGALLAGAPTKVGYFPDRQRWDPAVDKSDGAGIPYWMGIDLEDPPTPTDLQRPKMLPGHPVELGDGNEWEIPIARYFPDGSPLPSSLVLGDGGVWRDEPLEDYLEFSKMAERLMPTFYGEQFGKPTVTNEQSIEMVCDALRFNYRINRAGVSLLRLLSLGIVRGGKQASGTLTQALGAIVDLQGSIELSAELANKKKEPIQESQTSPD